MKTVTTLKQGFELTGPIQVQPLPVETSRQGIEVIRTFCTSAAARTLPKVVNGYAYRCVKCNEIWFHRIQAYRHECAGVTLLDF
jgi:hypothetical protein